MINFRYHLVSLIGVFLALAVGVVLGAGPLQNAISNVGSDEAAVASVADLQEELAAASAEGEAGQELASALAEQVLPGTMSGKNIAVVVLPDATSADVDVATSALEQAGAQVLGPVELTEAFVSQDANTYRETLASPVSSYLAGRPADPSPAAVLATGLVETLTVDSPDAELIGGMLTDEATPLVVALSTELADGLMLVGAGSERPAGVDQTQSGNEAGGDAAVSVAPLTRDGWIALGTAFADASVPAVAVGQAATADQFIAVLREAGSPLATADRGGSPMGALNAVLALASGATGSYGTQSGALEVLAPLP
ncbi:copper transporter [Schaalia sp. JY-X169]|uniref:copper transporter n=1 Tax=Schaalia sp. JY-X169 TaxID=2758572 RepID=UPI0015F3580B|nr:copper transporter [Schaalia sp. JY-X169]